MASNMLLYPGFRKVAYQFFSVANGIIAFGCIATEIIQPTLGKVGIWTAVIYLLTGALGLSASCKFSKNLFVATIVSAAISIACGIVGVVLSFVSIEEICGEYNPPNTGGSLLLSSAQQMSSDVANSKSSIYDGLTPEEQELLCALFCYNVLAWSAIAFVDNIILMALTPSQVWCCYKGNNVVHQAAQQNPGGLPVVVAPGYYYGQQTTVVGHSVSPQYQQYPQYQQPAYNSQQVPMKTDATINAPVSYQSEHL